MPVRSFTRDQAYLLPVALDEWVPADHPVRYVAAFVEELSDADWQALGVDRAGASTGAPAYHPALLLSVWLAGFMQGIRSARKLEAACRDQLSFRWLTGTQTPDHNTLWRFYQAHRAAMRGLLRRTVRVALASGLLDLALVAIDGTKLAGNAARDRTLDAADVAPLLARLDMAIVELEASNASAGDAPPARLPERLAQAVALRAQVAAALALVTAEDGPAQVNLTDPEARLLKPRSGYLVGYNAQAAVAATVPDAAGQRQHLIVAAEVTTDADDHAQLLPVLDATTANVAPPFAAVAADTGYHAGATLTEVAARGQVVVIPEPASVREPFHKQQFAYDATTDTYTCPHGHRLTYRGEKRRTGQPVIRLYRITQSSVCRDCPAFGVCTRDRRQGRALEVGPHEAALTAHRVWMATDAAQALLARRKTVVEPTFGVLKEQRGARRLLLRGLANVQAEWSLVATAANLRTLARAWAAGRLGETPGRPVTAGDALLAASTTVTVAPWDHWCARVRRWAIVVGPRRPRTASTSQITLHAAF
jgi:transposase